MSVLEAMKRFLLKLGFSLVELMVVLSIVSILVGLVAPKMREFQMKAKEAEVYLGHNNLKSLVETYESENGNVKAGDLGVIQSNGLLLSNISVRNKATSTACHRENLFGFKVQNCKKSRFNYQYRSRSFDTKRWGLVFTGHVCYDTNVSQYWSRWHYTRAKGLCMYESPTRDGCSSSNYSSFFSKYPNAGVECPSMSY